MSAVTLLETLVDGPDFSHVRMHIEGINQRVSNTDCDAFYKWEGGAPVVFSVGGCTEVLDTDNTTVYIPKGTVYSDMCTAVGGALLESCMIPPFHPDQVVTY